MGEGARERARERGSAGARGRGRGGEGRRGDPRGGPRPTLEGRVEGLVRVERHKLPRLGPQQLVVALPPPRARARARRLSARARRNRARTRAIPAKTPRRAHGAARFGRGGAGGGEGRERFWLLLYRF